MYTRTAVYTLEPRYIDYNCSMYTRTAVYTINCSIYTRTAVYTLELQYIH